MLYAVYYDNTDMCIHSARFLTRSRRNSNSSSLENTEDTTLKDILKLLSDVIERALKPYQVKSEINCFEIF